jgi:hypothetical protein
MKMMGAEWEVNWIDTVQDFYGICSRGSGFARDHHIG